MKPSQVHLTILKHALTEGIVYSGRAGWNLHKKATAHKFNLNAIKTCMARGWLAPDLEQDGYKLTYSGRRLLEELSK